MRRCGLGLALLVGSCAAPPPPPPPQVETEPPYRSIIAEHLTTMFAQDAQMRAISISGARSVRTMVGQDWLVCLRGTANSAAGGSGTRTYAIFINKRNEIVDRRLAEPKDGCDREHFEPLATGSR